MKLLYENCTTEYASGIGIDISNKQTEEPQNKRANKTKCRCGSTTHLKTRSFQFPLNKKNLTLDKIEKSDHTNTVEVNFEEDKV